MRPLACRIFLPALLLAWAGTHATVFGGDGDDKKRDAKKEPTSAAEIRKVLDQPITLDYSGPSVQDALQHLRDKTGIDFNLDQVALQLMGINIGDTGDQPITLRSSGGKLSAALRKMLAVHQLAYVIYEDSILITATELATVRQMRQRINLDVSDVSLAKALRDLARTYAFNLVIDPRIVKDAQRPVSLTLDGTSLETGVRLLAELAGLKAVRMDNVMFITTEERAEKLRKEEKELQPNPLDDLTNPATPKAGAVVPGDVRRALGLAGPEIRPLPWVDAAG